MTLESRAELAPRRLTREPVGDEGLVLHVDFTDDELSVVLPLLASCLAGSSTDISNSKELAKAIRKDKKQIPELARIVSADPRLAARTVEDIQNFLRDLSHRSWTCTSNVLVAKRDAHDKDGRQQRNARYFSLLATRETHGAVSNAFAHRGRYVEVGNGLRNVLEDELDLKVKWEGAAGDIMTAAWVSNQAFICGATTHSDARNQQYNKPKNLMLGSVTKRKVQAYADHRIVRPIVSEGSNATAEMAQSQDPWLYSSVVYSDFDSNLDLAFTASFDNTVKIWNVDGDGSDMRLVGTWQHEGRVNYVVSTVHDPANGLSMVATAADVATGAVRVYSLGKGAPPPQTYRSFSGSHAEGESSARWAYMPATIRWGLAEGVRHLLLVGFSPRSTTGEDSDIPEDKVKTGEIRLWDCIKGESLRISTASMCNVFEIAWHPTKPCFVAATTPTGQKEDRATQTQIRIFSPSSRSPGSSNVYSEKKVLDCTAADINQLVLRPYSYKCMYIAAGCTNGKTYVWDTGVQSARPWRTLSHGAPLEVAAWDELPDQEKEDSGIQFVSWGRSLDRFYTGSSDGVVKVWNLRAEGNRRVRTLLECPAAVVFGAFSPDYSHLVVGDASGKVFLLSTHDPAEDEWGGDTSPPPATQGPGQTTVTIRAENGRRLTRRAPNYILPHPDPPPPTHDAAGRPVAPETGAECAAAYLSARQLVVSREPTVGAVQGPRYAETGLFLRSAHVDGDPAQPLLAADESRQQFALKQYGRLAIRAITAARRTSAASALADEARVRRVRKLHRRNCARDFDLRSCDDETRRRLLEERAELGLQNGDVYGESSFEYEGECLLFDDDDQQ